MDTLGNMLQKGGSNLLVGGVFGQVNWDEDLLSLRINITDIDTSLMREEDEVALQDKSG